MGYECIIGILNHCDCYDLITLAELEKHIEESIEYNKSLDDDPLLKNVKELRAKCWTLKSYGDKRKSTDLTRFDYCPECGKKIDWAGIRNGAMKEAT